MGVVVEAVGDPLADDGRVELAHEDVPVVEVWVEGAVGEGCVGHGVPLLAARKRKTTPSG